MSDPLVDSQPRFETAPAAERSSLRVARLLPLDGLRGLIMVAMALDHANVFVAREHPSPEFWGGSFPSYFNALAFLTRLMTHVAAPGFFFLMGAGMALFATSRRELSWSEGAIVRHFVSRGALLIVLQLLVENPAWRIGADVPFGPQVFLSYIGVLYALGAAMIAGALFLWLRPTVLIGLSLLTALATELAISLVRNSGAAAPSLPLQLVLVPWRAPDITVFYPLVPWLGLALFGMAFGRWLAQSRAQAYRRALAVGVMMLALFVALRLVGGFGNIRPPAGAGWIAFLNVVKYPPSIVFILLTLGVDLLILAVLALAGAALGRWAQPLLVFGSSLLFFYIAHLYLYGLIGLVLGPRGVGIPRMYPFWLLGLAILYPLCWLYGRFKRSRAPDSVWRLF